MSSRFLTQLDSSITNPVRGENRLKLGVFGLNSIGCALTLAPEAYSPSWSGSLAAAVAADRAGFDAIVPYARWKSYVPGKPEHRSSHVMECFTWAAAVAASTSHSAIFATCHAPVLHPIVAAKMIATIDQISCGRAGLNIVAGWHSGEMSMLGIELGDHDDRYALAAEWVEILKASLRADGAFSFEGDSFTVDEAFVFPGAAQAGSVPIMNAGGSPRGRTFAAAHADIVFSMIEDERSDAIRATVDGYQSLARAQGREIAVWTPAHVVIRETDAEAERFVRYYGTEMGDRESADAFIAGQISSGSNLPAEVLDRLRTRIMQGGGGFPLVGTAETVARRLDELSQAGIDGVLLSWLDYEPGIRQFEREVLPLLEARGLRATHTAATTERGVGNA